MQRHILVAATSIATSTLFLARAPRKSPHRRRPSLKKAKPAAPAGADPAKFLTQPLDIDIYSADPSAQRVQRQDLHLSLT
jgi:hypothetical protein